MRKAQALREACSSDLAGVEDARSRTLSLGWELDVTVLEILQGSGASSPHLRVLRFRSPLQVRLLREA